MNNKDLIVQLLQQDLKHNQLTEGLRNLGLDDGGLHSLNILPIISQLMGVPEGKATNNWDRIYISFLDEAHKNPISARGIELKSIAEKCYEMLLVCAEIENRIQLKD